MPSQEKKHLENIIKPVLKQHGFRKRGGNWWRHSEDFIQVVNLQGSQWSKSFYNNLGIYVRDLGDKEWPSEADCHVGCRLEEICDPESRLFEMPRLRGLRSREQFASLLVEAGLAWLEECSNLDRLRTEYKIPNRVLTAWQREMLEEYFS